MFMDDSSQLMSGDFNGLPSGSPGHAVSFDGSGGEYMVGGGSAAFMMSDANNNNTPRQQQMQQQNQQNNAPTAFLPDPLDNDNLFASPQDAPLSSPPPQHHQHNSHHPMMNPAYKSQQGQMNQQMHQQHQQQQQSSHNLGPNPVLNQATFQTHPLHGMTGPPAHLFASPFSAFQQAQFEVENDQNGVNPSNFAIPSMTRTGTGESLGFSSNPLAIGPMTPQISTGSFADTLNVGVPQGNYRQQSQTQQFNNQQQRSQQQPSKLLGAYVSDIDQQDGMAPPNQPHSRKRARGPVQDHEGLDLNSSTQVLPLMMPTSNTFSRSQQSSINRSADAEIRTLDTTQRGPSTTPLNHGRASTVSSDNTGDDMNDKDETKKIKHQQTDRQRRAKIKESMDALKALVPLEPNQKADQATIVASSVTLVQNLKDEVADLRRKLQELELDRNKEALKLQDKRANLMRGVSNGSQYQQTPPLSNAPFTSMMASLNGAGVSMWRIGLTGKIIEVNLVFELVSGFHAAEVIGNTPCGPPLFGSLSIMPAAFLKAFSSVSNVPQLNAAGESLEHMQSTRFNHSAQIHNGHTPSSQQSDHSPQPLEFPGSPHSQSSSGASSNGTAPQTPNTINGQPAPVKFEVDINPNSTATASSQASVAPLYANASISNFPIVPQNELLNFFPKSFPCRNLIRSQEERGIMQPQPHGNFLFNHLAALPANHVLKLLSRHHTLWGDILESIVTLCLVRDSSGQPDYVLLLSTPSERRLLTPATHQQSRHMAPVPEQSRMDLDAMCKPTDLINGVLTPAENDY